MGLIVNSWVRNGWALWASRLALFAIQLFIVGFVLHRFQILSTPLTLGLLTVTSVFAVLGGIAAIVGFVQIWHYGGRGGLRSSFALAVALVTLAWPAVYLPQAASLPAINDVSTDLATPPQFVASDKAPTPRGFLASSRNGPQEDLQVAGYPDLRPLVVNRTLAAAFDAARTIAEREGYEIIRENPPRQGQRRGDIQAVDETLVMGFRDDIVIRVRPEGDQTRVDIRSASRYGKHDFGRNATRVRRLSRQLRARLDFTLPASLEEEADTEPVVSKSKTRKRKTRKIRQANTKPRSPRVRKKRQSRSRSKVRRGRARKALQRE